MTADDQPLADLQRSPDGWVVRFERRLAHPREKVWRAITESDHLAHWLPCDIVGPRTAGAAVDLPFWPSHVARYGLEATPALHGEIRVWDPPSVFEWTWDTDVLRWELSDVAGGTLLRFTTWIAPGDEGAIGTSAGYHVCLGHLQELLDAGAPSMPLVDVDTAALERRYREAIAER